MDIVLKLLLFVVVFFIILIIISLILALIFSLFVYFLQVFGVNLKFISFRSVEKNNFSDLDHVKINDVIDKVSDHTIDILK